MPDRTDGAIVEHRRFTQRVAKASSLAGQPGYCRRAHAGQHRNREHPRADEAKRTLGANGLTKAERLRRLGWRGDTVMRAPGRRVVTLSPQPGWRIPPVPGLLGP